jgi:asparagine synthase (glutamine-hydrolysing)
MARVPLAQKYKNRQGKYLARQILYKHISKTLIDKPKAGFQIPLAEWLRNELKPLVEKYIDTTKLDGEIFDLDEVLRIKRELMDGNTANFNAIWFILMYEMWRERWFG